MTDHVQAPTPAAGEPPAERPVSFFTLDPRRIGRKRLVRALAIGLLVLTVSIVPLWRLLWFFPLYGFMDFLPTRGSDGVIRAAWRWHEGREIRVYAAPGVARGKAETICAGAQAAVDDVGLNFTVKVLPMPPKVLEAYRASLVERPDPTLGGSHRRQMVSYNALSARLTALRAGDPHADLLVVKTPMTECWWAHGMASFTRGVGVMIEDNVDFHLGKHETCHLLGYHYHDSLPLFVIGYPWEGLPNRRDTLMMLLGDNTELSPRARDALRYFWRGMERRAGTTYLRN